MTWNPWLLLNCLILWVELDLGLACPVPRLPLASKLRVLEFSSGSPARVEFGCQDGYKPVGEVVRSCTGGKWPEEPMICAANAALQKPTFTSQSETGSLLTVNGAGDSQGNKWLCAQIGGKSPWWKVDLLQSVPVIGINITTHKDAETLSFLEVRVGDESDFKENQLCQYLPSLNPKDGATFVECSEDIRGRYVSISKVNTRVPLVLCEVEVLTPPSAVTTLVQCGKDRSTTPSRGLMVLDGQCLLMDPTQGKRSFQSANHFCKGHGMTILHNRTQADHKIYQYVRKKLTEYSIRERKKVLAWVGLKKSSSTWSWMTDNSSFLMNHVGGNTRLPRAFQNLYNTSPAEVSWENWAPGEPSPGVNCAVVDSSLRWSWNAIGCAIDAMTACHSTAQYCPSYDAPEGGSLPPSSAFPDEDRGLFRTGTVVNITCDIGYEPIGSPSRFCQPDGQWSPLSLSCKFQDCGLVNDSGLDVEYLDNRTTWGARLYWRCAEGWKKVGEATRGASCGEAGWDRNEPTCVKMSCGEAPQVDFASISYSVKNNKILAIYKCDVQKTLVVGGDIVCDGGEWRGEAPVCISVTAATKTTTTASIITTTARKHPEPRIVNRGSVDTSQNDPVDVSQNDPASIDASQSDPHSQSGRNKAMSIAVLYFAIFTLMYFVN